jgi:hypothetical protein
VTFSLMFPEYTEIRTYYAGTMFSYDSFFQIKYSLSVSSR